MPRCPVEGLALFVGLLTGGGAHLQPTFEHVALVRAWAEVAGEPHEGRAEVRAVGEANERHRHLPDLGQPWLDIVVFDRNRHVVGPSAPSWWRRRAEPIAR